MLLRQESEFVYKMKSISVSTDDIEEPTNESKLLYGFQYLYIIKVAFKIYCFDFELKKELNI